MEMLVYWMLKPWIWTVFVFLNEIIRCVYMKRVKTNCECETVANKMEKEEARILFRHKSRKYIYCKRHSKLISYFTLIR